MTTILHCSEAEMQGKVRHKDKRRHDRGMLEKKKKAHKPTWCIDSGWISSSKQEAERTSIILETSPTDEQRITIQRTSFRAQPGVRKNAEAFCVGIVLGREQQWLPGSLLIGRTRTHG